MTTSNHSYETAWKAPSGGRVWRSNVNTEQVMWCIISSNGKRLWLRENWQFDNRTAKDAFRANYVYLHISYRRIVKVCYQLSLLTWLLCISKYLVYERRTHMRNAFNLEWLLSWLFNDTWVSSQVLCWLSFNKMKFFSKTILEDV